MARKQPRLTEETLNAILDKELHDSVGMHEEKLAEDQGDAIDRYMGKKYGTEVDGRSHYVSRDVMDTIEWIMPTLMDIYYSTDTPVQIEPQNQSDIVQAQQETAYLSYVLNRKNPGFHIVHNFVKDGLLQKLGIVKHWWDESENAREEPYEQLTTAELEMLLSNEDVIVVEHTAFLDGQETSDFIDDPSALHDVLITRVESHGQIKIENVPHEEFRIDRRATRKDNASYMGHVTIKTVSELIDMGFDRDMIETLAMDAATNEGSEKNTSPQHLARFHNDSTDPKEYIGTRTDLAMRELRLEEHYIRVDWNNDGIAEIRQVFRINKEIIENEEVPSFPFSFWSPLMMPHKLVGLSVVDLVEDLQKIKTHLTRAMIDNVNAANNGGWTVIQGMANLEDLMTTGPMRIVRQRVPDAVKRLDHPSLPPEAFQLLSYIDKVREERTGVNPLQQGMDEKVLGSNTAVGAVSQMMTAAMQRIQLIARVLAETGLKELFQSIHQLAQMHVGPGEVFRLHEQFIDVNPNEWVERIDFTVTVGTGHANKDQKLIHLNLLGQDIQNLVAGGGLGTLVSPQNLYNLMREKFQAAGFKDYSQFITDPSQVEEQPPTEEEEMQKAILLKEMELKEREAAREDAEVRIKVAEAQIKEGEARVSAAKAEAEIAQIRHEAAMREIELDLKQQELELEKQQGRGVKIG